MSATPSADIPQFEIGSERGPDDICIVRVAGEVDMAHEDAVREELRRAFADFDGRRFEFEPSNFRCRRRESPWRNYCSPSLTGPWPAPCSTGTWRAR